MSKYKFKNYYGGDNEKIAIQFKDAGFVCENLRVSLEEATKYINKLKNEISNYKNNNIDIIKEKDNFKNQIKTLEDNIKNKETEIKDLRLQITKFQDDFKTFENFADKTASTINDFKNSINDSNYNIKPEPSSSITDNSEEEEIINEFEEQMGGKRNKKRKSPKKILRKTSKKRNSPKK